MARCSSVAVSPADFSSVLVDKNKPNKRPQKHANPSKSKHRKQFSKEKATVSSFDDDGVIDSSNDGDEDDCIQTKKTSTANTPAFVGHRIASDPPQSTPNPRSTVSSMMQQLLAVTSKLESQYLRPLVVAQERIEAMTKCLFVNQKKIQKTLRKQKVSSSLFKMSYDDWSLSFS